MEQDRKPTMSVPEAGKKYFDLGRNASYAAAARGDIPTIRMGGRLRAVVPALERMIAEAGRSRTDPSTENLEAGHYRR